MYIVIPGTSGLSPDELASLDDSNLSKACTNLQHASKSYEICENVGIKLQFYFQVIPMVAIMLLGHQNPQ